MALPFTGSLNRTISASAENLNASIDSLSLPFETELRRYVVADDTNVDSLITNMKSLMDDLKALTVSMASHLLSPSSYNDALSYSILTSLESAITTNLVSMGDGLPAATMSAQWNRARERAIAAGNRGVKKVVTEIAKRLPYAGMIADAYEEANYAYIGAVNDVNRDITIEQARLTYQNQRDKIREAAQMVGQKMQDFHTQRARALQAYITYDQQEIQNHWNYYEFLLRRALGFVGTGIEFALKAASGPDQITFENWLKMSKIMGDAQLQISALIGDLMPGSSLS